jgi:hypothetical protein
MDAIKLIKQDHRTVKGLFARFEQATKRSDRQRIAEEIIEELSVHATIEEQILYPALRERDKDSEEDVLNALEEHHAAKLTLAELDKMNVDDERYDAKMHVVQEAVEMHIEEEESELLPKLERIFRPREREEMGKVILALKKTAPNHPHPMAPDTPPAGAISGLLAKISDAGKDLVRKVTDQDKAAGHRQVTRRATRSAASAKAKAKGTGTRTGRKRSRTSSTARRAS